MPFLSDDNNDEYYSDDGFSHFDQKRKNVFELGDKKFYLIGGCASIVVFVLIIAYIYSNNRPVDLGELPVIQAEDTPIKVKAESNQQVDHQDKLVYDNISGDTRVLQEHIAPKPEEPIDDAYHSEISNDDVLSQEEKENIIREFDELAPRKKYAQIESGTVKKELKNTNKKAKANALPPINDIEKSVISQLNKKKKNKRNQNIKSTENAFEKNKKHKGTIMVQIASVGSKNAAEAEYKRIVRKNPFLKNVGKHIMKVDLGVKGIKYRVQVGPFDDRKKASKAIASMKNNGFFGYISK